MSETAPQYSPSGNTTLTEAADRTPQGRTTARRKLLRERVQEVMDQRGMTQAQLAEETGLSRSVISQWLAGKYEHDQGDVIRCMKAWIERAEGALDHFVDLRNSKRVFEACQFAVERRTISIVVGRPGLGKTVALKEFHRRSIVGGAEILYHFCSPAIKQNSLCKMMARRFGLSERGTTYDLLESVVAYLRRRPVPMIFDEANHLNVPCLEALRYIFDQVGTPIVLCGSIELQRTLSDAGDRHLELEQLQSRVGLRIMLKTLDQQDVKRILERHFAGVELHPDAIREFQARSKGVVRDLCNGIASVKELMRINKISLLDADLIRAAFERQFIN